MDEEHAQALLTTEDGPAFRVVNPSGTSRLLLTCEHASNRVPQVLDGLSLPREVLESHAAWDPGAFDLARRISEKLDATLVAAEFSRLVFDVNRPPQAEDAIRTASEVYRIPRNVGLGPHERAARKAALYDPFHDAVSGILEARLNAGAAPVLVTVHSFTPTYFGKPRDLELGVLFDEDRRLAAAVLARAAAHTALSTRPNEPYGPSDGVTHTLRTHAIPRGIANVMLEVRNDLLREAQGAEPIAHELAGLLQDALGRLDAARQSAGAEG